MRSIRVGNEDVVVAFVCDFALPAGNEREKGDANKENDGERFHVCGVLTDGKRAFLIKRLKFFRSVDIRKIESSFSPAARLRKRTLSLSSQTPSQPNNFFGVSLVAFCDCISNAQSAGSGRSQFLRPDSSPISMLRSNHFPLGDTSMRPS